jgi:CobQ-like glutamine amidotransferase family enzyme
MSVADGTGERGDQVGIVHLYPALMGTYGDGGNVKVLVRRLAARGIGTRVVMVGPDDPVPADADLYVLGGGEDISQIAAARALRQSGALVKATDRGAVIFAVCAGLQVLGHDFEVSGGQIEPGLGLLDATTRRREPRAVGEVLAEPLDGSPLLSGYENHGGGTALGPAAAPLARVKAGIGNGAGGSAGDGTEGAVQDRIVATYLHGPVLARNPGLADRLAAMAIGVELAPLDAPWVNELRTEREHYVRSGKLSAESVRTPR